jgi:hypothetical protein
MDYKIEFIDKEITPFGGLALVYKMLERIGIFSFFKDLELPQPGSNRGYKAIDIVISFMLSVWCGANRFSHTEITRQDNALKKIFKLKEIPSSSTITRFFKKFSIEHNSQIFFRINTWFFNNIHFDKFTIDFDSTVITRYGSQEGSAKGYNPQKPGRKSHHPLMAFIDDCNMIANFWLRPGNTSSANNFIAFLEDTLKKLSGKVVGLLRADSGFYAENIFECLELKNISYIISAKFYSTIKKAIAKSSTWLYLAEGVEVSEIMYKNPNWKTARRLVMVRQKISRRPKAAGRQITLFGEIIDNGAYRYSCFVTNIIDLPSAVIWRTYRGRANAENRIKELKYDFGFDSFNMDEFYATEAALGFVMLAYNLMSLFKHAVIRGDKMNMLSTLKYKLFNISAFITKNGNAKILNLALISKRRQWFLGLWDNSKTFAIPVQY